MNIKIVKLLFGIYFGFFTLAIAGYAYSWRESIPPAQPIAFSHKIHAGKLNIRCMDCHVNADKSRSATPPPMEKCMSCHRSAALGSPEVQKIHASWESKEPVEWVRIHQLPEHVNFTHKRHIKAGVDCASCHGEVKVMDEIRKVRTLSMGWCVSCHTAKGVSIDCLTCHK